MTEEKRVLAARKISKRFGAVQALQEVDFDLRRGEIHGLVGENGAGKSTLMKILAGVYPPDSGSLYLDGRPTFLRSPKQAYDLGIRIVHQELSLVPSLTVAENLYLHEFCGGHLARVNRKDLVSRAEVLLQEWGLEIPAGVRIERLPMGKRQLVEIARELYREGRIFILDEPTSSLSHREIDHLFQVLRALKQKGVSVVFISHRLSEVLRLADTVSVLRNGTKIDSRPAAGLQLEDMIALMLGREMRQLFPLKDVPPGKVILSVRELSGEGFSRISLDLRQGEILGIAGMMGAGRSELLRALFGLQPVYSGSVELDGEEVRISDPITAIRLGFVLLSESRIDEGVFPDLSVGNNLVLTKLEELTSAGWLRKDRIQTKVSDLVARLRIATCDADRQSVKELSGGNQQKAVLGRLIGADPRILLLDEPTRGVDVGTKAEIHQIMVNLAAEGRAIIMVSSDVSELIGMCDRILVLQQGRLVTQFGRQEASEERVVQCCLGDRR